MKKLYFLILISLLLISFTSALELNPFADSKEFSIVPLEEMSDYIKTDFNTNYGVITITSNFLWIGTGTVAEYSLTRNTEYCIINCEAEGKVKLYSDGVLFTDTKFKTLNGEDTNIKSSQYYLLNGYIDNYVEVPDTYKEVCVDVPTNTTNKTDTKVIEELPLEPVQECSLVPDTYKLENQPIENWVEYNGEKVRAGEYRWKIKGVKEKGQSVDFIPIANSKEFSEWAVWNSSFTLGLTGYYNFDEGTGTKVEEVSEGIYNGTFVGSPVWTTGKIGNALNFSSNNRVNITGVKEFSTEKVGTVSAWVWLNSCKYMYVFHQEGTGGASPDAMGLGFYSTTCKIGYPKDNTGSWNFGNTAVGTGAWHHVAIVFTDGTMYYYLDGSPDGSGSRTNFVKPFINSQIGDNQANAVPFLGSIDELGIWNRSLSASEISDLYNNGSGLTYEATVPAGFPIVSLISPENAVKYSTSPQSITFECNATGDVALTNLTLNAGSNSYNVVGNGTQTYLNISKSYSFTDGSYSWNCTATDNLNQSTQPSSRTFEVDSTKPTITVNYPTGLIDYGYTGKNFPINFTVNDTNLDKVWYYYNGTNKFTNDVSGTFSSLGNWNDGNLSTKTIGNFGNLYANYSLPSNIDYSNLELKLNVYYYITDTPTLSSNETKEIPPSCIINDTVQIIYSSNHDYDYYYYCVSPSGNIQLGHIYGTEMAYLIDSFFSYNYLYDSIVSATSGVQTNFSFPLSTYKNITIYANDTFGNLNYTFFSWDYKILEKNRIYNPTSFVSSIETFGLNITTDGTETPLVYLNYDGSRYYSTLINGVYYVNVTILSSGIKTFFWNITYGSENIITYSSNQTVLNITLMSVVDGSCPSGYSKVLNFTFFDEHNLTSLQNVNVKYNFKYGIVNSTGLDYYGNINATELSVCLNTTQSSSYYIGYGEIDYTKTDYSSRRYYVFGGTRVTNQTTYVPLYSLLESFSTSFLIKVIEPALNPYVDKYTTLLRWYPNLNEYKVVEMGRTDDKGETVNKVEVEDVDYRIGIYDLDGTLIHLASPIRMVCLSSPCSYTLNVPISEGYKFDEIYNIQTLITYSNGLFTLTYNDPSQNTELMQLIVYKLTGSSQSKICEDNSTSFTGILNCNVSSYEGTLKAVAYRSASPSYLVDSKIVQTAITIFQGTFGLFLQLIIMITLIFAGVISPVVSIILGIISLLIGTFLLKSFSFSVFIGFGIVGGIVIYLMRRSTQ